MADQYFHVRFKLRDLLVAAQADLGLDYAPAVADALTYYWNWAGGRGWSLVSVMGYRDTFSAFTAQEAGNPQLEIISDEHYSVVWRGDDVEGSPDMVSELKDASLDNRFRTVFKELARRGWVEDDNEYFVKEGRGLLSVVDVEEVASAKPHLSAESIADELEDRVEED